MVAIIEGVVRDRRRGFRVSDLLSLYLHLFPETSLANEAQRILVKRRRCIRRNLSGGDPAKMMVPCFDGAVMALVSADRRFAYPLMGRRGWRKASCLGCDFFPVAKIPEATDLLGISEMTPPPSCILPRSIDTGSGIRRADLGLRSGGVLMVPDYRGLLGQKMVAMVYPAELIALLS
ncbi:hypothetical protein U1Q18_043152 [Sarracenia purpurea var. burkii]